MKTTAAVLLVLLTMAGPALALTVSAKVGPLIKDAQTLIQHKNYTAALAKVNEAEAVKVTSDDEIVISQFKQLIEKCENGGCPAHP